MTRLLVQNQTFENMAQLPLIPESLHLAATPSPERVAPFSLFEPQARCHSHRRRTQVEEA
jgi:hypothetical protein